MNAKLLQKYQKYNISKLKKLATKYFNAYIRNRDKNNGCISCNSPTFTDAGHFYSGGHYSALKFNENNVHGQCKRCNYFLHGNLNEYRKKLIQKIGIKEVEKLDDLVAFYKRASFKWSRIELIEIIEKYRKMSK